MSLEGSLETIALPEVLQLLSDTSKSGELLVSGDRGDGRLWFDGGRLSGFDVQRCAEASDALFELLRAASGRFTFDVDKSKPETANSVGGKGGEDVRPILEVAQAHLEEWAGIVAVVPSLEHRVTLSAEAPGDTVKLSADQWALAVVIGEGRTVGEVLDRAGLAEFEGCRSVKALVEDGLVSVSEAAEPVVVEPETVVEPEAVVEPVTFEIEEPEAEVAEPAVAYETSVHDEVEPVADEPANGVVVSGGVFDGQDFVFKAPVQASDDSYEPQAVPFPDTYSNGHAVVSPEAGVADDASMTSRAALEALLAEIPADGEPDGFESGAEHVEAHDGLADRGPWTSQELASFDEMGGWQDDAEHSNGEYDFSPADAGGEGAAHASEYHFEEGAADYSAGEHAAPVAQYEEADAGYEDTDQSEAEEEQEEDPQPEPVNRGLLLKFLSSVRS